MGISVIIAAVKTFIDGAKILKNPLAWVIVCVVLSFFLYRSCDKQRELSRSLTDINTSSIAHENNTANALKIELSKKEYKLHLKEGRISELLDSLSLKPKQVISYKYIKTDRFIHDTLVELELIDGFDYKREFKFTDKCFSAIVDFSGQNPTIDAKVSNEILDINYFERRKLFGLKFTPRIGRKEFYQTLISPCGDTIKKNEQISYKK